MISLGFRNSFAALKDSATLYRLYEALVTQQTRLGLRVRTFWMLAFWGTAEPPSKATGVVHVLPNLSQNCAFGQRGPFGDAEPQRVHRNVPALKLKPRRLARHSYVTAQSGGP